MMLKPLEGLEFHPEAHKYRWDGKWLPLSPTQVLSLDLDDHAKAIIADTKEGEMGWEARGNACHAALEQHLLGAARLDPGPFAAWIDPLLDCWLWEDIEVMGVELRLTDKRRMGGSCDFLIKTPDGSLCLGDLKSVGTEKAVARRKPATEQLGAYLHMLAKSYPKVCVDKVLTVVAGPGKTRVITGDPAEAWIAWENAMSRYQAHQDLTLGF